MSVALIAATPNSAPALTIELKDVAPDRIERQRRAAEGALPLPGTPNAAAFTERLAEHGVTPGMPVLIRVFKQESELELWVKRDEAYILFATYPVCQWSGTLGPKLSEGDKQTPEGFYTVTRRQLHRIGRWPKALNLGFPNAYDKKHDRTGSYILVHGGCSSVGCFAMTNTVIEEIFTLTSAALRRGQTHVPVHVFPFRMTEANLARHASSPWRDFWLDLKEGYDSFERRRLPPKVSICEGRYTVADTLPSDVETPAKLVVAKRRSMRLASLDGAIVTRCPQPPSVATSHGDDRPVESTPTRHESPPVRSRIRRGAAADRPNERTRSEDESATRTGALWQDPALVGVR